jgi:hypothetical protein
VNTKESQETTYIKANCLKLTEFIKLMDSILNDDKVLVLEESLQWKSSVDSARIFNELL